MGKLDFGLLDRQQNQTENRENPVYGEMRIPPYVSRIGSAFSQSFAISIPGAEQPPENHQLTQMVGVMISEQHGFAQQGLPGTVRKGSEQVKRAVFYKSLHPAEVGREEMHAAIPGRG